MVTFKYRKDEVASLDPYLEALVKSGCRILPSVWAVRYAN